MPNYIDPVEEAYNKGEGSIVAGRGVGLRGKLPEQKKKKKKKDSRLKRLVRLLKKAAIKAHYYSPPAIGERAGRAIGERIAGKK